MIYIKIFNFDKNELKIRCIYSLLNYKKNVKLIISTL